LTNDIDADPTFWTFKPGHAFGSSLIPEIVTGRGECTLAFATSARTRPSGTVGAALAPRRTVKKFLGV
jgi:hypothetical protein